MMMADGTAFIPVAFAGFGRGIGGVVRCNMDVRAVMIMIIGHFNERDSRPVDDVGHNVLGLHHAMQIHRRQNSDGQQRAEDTSRWGHEASRENVNTGCLGIRQRGAASIVGDGHEPARRCLTTILVCCPRQIGADLSDL